MASFITSQIKLSACKFKNDNSVAENINRLILKLIKTD